MSETSEFPYNIPFEYQIRYLELQVGKLAPEEIHKISTFISIRNVSFCQNSKAARIRIEKCEKVMRAFITRRKLGKQVTFEKIRAEFGI